jgi:hypothetical protein
MLQLRSGTPDDAERSDPAMNALAILYVNEHLQDILDETAAAHRHRADRPSLFDRIRSAASNRIATLALPIDDRGTLIPKLGDSPNRS